MSFEDEVGRNSKGDNANTATLLVTRRNGRVQIEYERRVACIFSNEE